MPTRPVTRRAFLAGASAALAALVAPIGSAAAAAPVRASEVLREAQKHLGQPYVWGGSVPGRFDCSGYVSWIWRIPRRSTDTIQDMCHPISREELMPGDAMNMPFVGRRSHIRIFDGWVTPNQELMWVYEAARGHGVTHRLISYDDRYTPVRRHNFIADMPMPPPELSADYPVNGGWFYSQTGSGDGKAGYAIVNADGVKLWDEFKRLGGVAALGYPVSRRFEWQGHAVQAVQKGLLQWRPEIGGAVLANVFDELHAAGKDQWLLEARATPKGLPPGFDDGKPWQEVVAGRTALLAAQPVIAARYAGVPDPLGLFGLPTSRIEDMGSHYAVRTQRAVIQLWKADMPWAKAGETTIANGGEILRDAGLVPRSALAPQRSPYADALR